MLADGHVDVMHEEAAPRQLLVCVGSSDRNPSSGDGVEVAGIDARR
jgi:hypothetical protein